MRIRTIIDKEWAEVFKNKMVLMTVLLFPLLFIALPIISMATMHSMSSLQSGKTPEVILQQCQTIGLTEVECLQTYLAGPFMLFFLLMPLAIPVAIAAYSIVGEKTTHSLEPLLATPVSTGELILGKGLAAALPAIAATWLSFAIFLIGARFVAASDRVYAFITQPMWFFAVLLLAPLLTVTSVNVTIWISSRVNDPRAAEQLGVMVMLPLLVVVFGQMAGVITISLTSILIASAVMLVIDIAMIGLGVKLSQRETILTRWK